jgi:hypothetical protein
MPFMEPKSSLPCSQEPIVGSCPDPDEFSPTLTPYSSGIHLNIVTDLINALPGNSFVNTNTGNNRRKTVFFLCGPC